jgi:hypothetical protein
VRNLEEKTIRINPRNQGNFGIRVERTFFVKKASLKLSPKNSGSPLNPPRFTWGDKR